MNLNAIPLGVLGWLFFSQINYGLQLSTRTNIEIDFNK